MAQYDQEHTGAWNKVLHGIGIPIILAGAVLRILTYWRRFDSPAGGPWD